MTCAATISVSNIDFLHLQTLPAQAPPVVPNRTQTGTASCPNCTAIFGTPYLKNLTPKPSELHPSCLAKDRLE